MELWGVSQDTLEQILGEYNVLEDEQVRELGVMPLMERAYEGEEVIIDIEGDVHCACYF